MSNDADPLEGQEISMLNQLLAQAWPLAKAGDAKAAERVIKILQMKQQRERAGATDEGWKL